MTRLTRFRPVDIGQVAAHDRDAVVVDEVLPLAVVVSADGRVGPMYTWELSPDHSGEATATASALETDRILVTSPAVGGVVSIDRSTAESSVTPADSPCVTIEDQRVGTIEWPPRDSLGRTARDPAELVYYDDERVVQRERSGELVSYARSGGGDQCRAHLPDGFGRMYVVSKSLIWFWPADRPVLLVIEPRQLRRRWIPITIDSAPYAPDLHVPKIDFATYEHEQLQWLRESFLGQAEWEGPVEGFTFESIELCDEFPYTEIVGIYTSDLVDGLRFGRRWRLYDDLGNLEDLGSVRFEFEEQWVTDSYSDRDADAAGIVWS